MTGTGDTHRYKGSFSVFRFFSCLWGDEPRAEMPESRRKTHAGYNAAPPTRSQRFMRSRFRIGSEHSPVPAFCANGRPVSAKGTSSALATAPRNHPPWLS